MTIKIDWYYHRNSWTSCTKAQEFLAEVDAKILEQLDARKVRIDADEALQMVAKVNQISVVKGKKLLHVDLKKSPLEEQELLKLIIGPSGNLRAPSIRRGKKMIVGFNAQLYDDQLR